MPNRNALFIVWLTAQLREREWNRADLARQSGLAEASLSLIYSGKRAVGEKSAAAIAKALHVPPDLVFERAGLLPGQAQHTPAQRRAIHLLEQTNDYDLELVIALLEALAKRKL